MNTYKQLSSLIEVLELTAEEQFDLSVIEGEDISVAQYEMLRDLEGAETLSVLKEIKSLLLQLEQPATQPTEPKQPKQRKRSSYYTVRFLDNNNIEGYAIVENKEKLFKFLDTLVKVNSELIDMFYTNLERNLFTKVKLIEHEGQLMTVGVIQWPLSTT